MGRKKTFSPSMRLKASSGQLARGLTSLYQPGLSKQAVREKEKIVARRTVGRDFLSKTVVFPGIMAFVFGAISAVSATNWEIRNAKRISPSKIVKEAASAFLGTVKFNTPTAFYHPLTKRVVANIRNPRMARGIMMHELVHATGVSKNHAATASAFETFFLQYRNMLEQRKFFLSEKMEYWQKAIAEQKKTAEIESAFKAGILATIRKASPFKEHFALAGKKPVAELGGRLGGLAFFVEARTKKPGAGFFFIREVSNGKSIKEAFAGIEQGKFDSEIEAWRKRNPVLSRFLQRFSEMAKEVEEAEQKSAS